MERIIDWTPQPSKDINLTKVICGVNAIPIKIPEFFFFFRWECEMVELFWSSLAVS